MKDFVNRCEKALLELSKIAKRYKDDNNYIEYNRIIGKIDGISLALDYYRQEKKENEQ